MIQKTGFRGTYSACTLKPCCIGVNSSGWVITGEVKSDYFKWVNAFEASHPIHGKVFGDFEKIVYTDSDECFQHFYENHTPKLWYYEDI